MVKAGIIIGVVALVLVLGSAFLISPFCAPCWGVLLGLAAGYLAGVFDHPAVMNDLVKKGAIAGAIAAAFAGLGSLIGGVINAAMLNPADLQSLGDALGVQLPNMDSTSIWTGQLGGACCVGLLNLALMAGLGAAGAALWWQISGKKRVEVQPPQY